MTQQTAEMIRSPFSDGAVPEARSGNAIADTATAREVQEVQAMMVIAKKFPRNERTAMDRILNACTRPTLAEDACYQYAKGGTDVTGPSIRLAEAIAQSWGNIQFGIRELEQRNGESTVEAFAWDLETNTRQSKVFQVPHLRHTKKGSYRLEDPREVYELVANQGARRLRACILGIIPGDVIDTAVRQCDVTLTTKVEVTTEKIKSMLDKFAVMGVTKEQIEKRIQRRTDAITPAQMVHLGKVYNSINDGMSKPEEWFEVQPASASSATTAAPAASTATAGAKGVDRLAGKIGATAPAAKPASDANAAPMSSGDGTLPMQ